MSNKGSGEHVLPDLLRPGLRLVLCGSAVGRVSALRGAPYAGPGNKFWPILAEIGLTPHLFASDESGNLLALGIGLTDLNKTESGADSALSSRADAPEILAGKVERYQPKLLAFTAKRPAAVFMRHMFGRKRVDYGIQPNTMGDTRLFVLPSPSGLAIRYWDPRPWHALAELYRASVEV